MQEQRAETGRLREPREESARRKDRGVPAGAASLERRQQRELVPPGLQRGRNALIRGQRGRRRVEDGAGAGGRQVAQPPLGLLLVGDHERERALEILGEGREQDRRKRAHAACDEQGISPADPFEEVRVEGKSAGEIPEQTVPQGGDRPRPGGPYDLTVLESGEFSRSGSPAWVAVSIA